MAEEISVMIIGAGGAGRLLAHGLIKRGIKPVLFEKDESVDSRQRDWDYGVHWAANLLYELLPPQIDMEKILTAQTDHLRPSSDTKIMCYRADTGALLKLLPTPNLLRLRKREFCRVLEHGLDIRHNKRLVSIRHDPTSGAATATFADGSSHTAPFLIGTDGSHSVVREYLVGHDKAQVLTAPIMVACAHCRLSPVQIEEFFTLTDRTAIAYIHDAYGKPNKEDWLFTYIVCYRTGNGPDSSIRGDELVRQMKECCADFAEPWKGIIDALSGDEHAWATPVSYWPTQPWPEHPSRGGVTLLGDAMHSLVPQRGQGMNNAILDVVDLMKEIDTEEWMTVMSIREAIKRYEVKVWKRGAEVVTESLENGMMVTDWEMLKESPLMNFSLAYGEKKMAETSKGTS